MARPRKSGKDLPPGLYCYPGRNCYIRMGGMKPVDLGTTDRETAKDIYWEFRKKWEIKKKVEKTDKVSSRLEAAITGTDRITVATYAKTWRTERLPTLTKKTGRPLGEKTRTDYARILSNQVESHEPFQKLALGSLSIQHIRQFLAPWITESPHFYNYVTSLLSRMLGFAVDEGLIDVNPVAQISRRPVTKRDVYMSDEHYLSITRHLAEFEARACDLLYLVSHRPADVLSLKEEQVDENTLRFTATKNEVDMEIEMNSDLVDTVQWFRDWKMKQDIDSAYLVVYPTSSKRRYIGKPLSVSYLSRRFAAAVVAAGLERGTYTLRDIRPKGLSDEFVVAGDSNKGGHKTEAMKKHYRRIKLPMRAKNNLKRIRYDSQQ
jgi:hypothetical protein